MARRITVKTNPQFEKSAYTPGATFWIGRRYHFRARLVAIEWMGEYQAKITWELL